MKNSWWGPACLIAVLLLAGYLRFASLERAAVRSDEINFLSQVVQQRGVVDIWMNPPWLNQIPLADSLALLWHKVRPGIPDEGTVREPFALLGWLTVAGVAVWTVRRRGWAAGLLAGLWLALLPLHVYQSREAYYYVVVMAFAAGLLLHTCDLLVRLRAGANLTNRMVAGWAAWAVLTCLTHMSTWVVVGMMGFNVMVAGLMWLEKSARKRHILQMLAAAGFIALMLVRWVFRALAEMRKVSQADGHIGAAFDWVAPRVLPFFLAGANPLGYALSAVVVVACLVLVVTAWRQRLERDPVYLMMGLVVGTGLLSAYLYIGLVGGGAAKIAYFTSLLPAVVVWAGLTFDAVAQRLPVRMGATTRVAMGVGLFVVLWMPAQALTRLDGKPVPYKVLRSWLDHNLDPGSVVVVDRWFEPWNEMARYAPSNVVVTFTVPDEPYENYVQLRWREVTQQAIESGRVQAFIRLARNHEERAGLWTWPEQYFKRRASVTNEVGVWLRNQGYAVSDDFYAANTNRLIADIFYDLRSDAVARHREAGRTTAVFFDASLPYEKSGPMGIFRFQTQQFMDWRVLEARGELEIYNLADESVEVMLQISAVAPRGAKIVSSNGKRQQFAAGQMQPWRLGPIPLAPGRNVVVLEDPRWVQHASPLLISAVEVQSL